MKKTKYDTEAEDLKLKIPDISGLLQTSIFNSKITEVENKTTSAAGKIPHTKNLTSKTELKTIENKIPDTKNLTSKTELSPVKIKYMMSLVW